MGLANVKQVLVLLAVNGCGCGARGGRGRRGKSTCMFLVLHVCEGKGLFFASARNFLTFVNTTAIA